MTYYTAVILLVWMALAILAVLVYENDKVTKKNRQMLFLTYGLIAVSALAEWLGIQLNGNLLAPEWILRIVKCIDFMLTPVAGYLLVRQLRIDNVIQKILAGILTFNFIFQFFSLFTDWMLIINEQNVYSHGTLYAIYLAEDAIVIMLIIAQFLVYSKSFRKRNRISLYAILAMVLVGILFQEVIADISGNEIRTDYIAMVFGMVFLYIHFNGYSQQTSDDRIRRQEIAIRTDALTGLKSRYAYSKTLKKYDEEKPESFAAFSIDINGLKEVNDTLGHEAGDELVKGVASCIRSVFGDNAYRTGGDEFVVLVKDMDETDATAAIDRLQEEAARWHGTLITTVSMSAGYALSKRLPGATAEEVVREADLQMYVAKDDYYAKNGKRRRRD